MLFIWGHADIVNGYQLLMNWIRIYPRLMARVRSWSLVYLVLNIGEQIGKCKYFQSRCFSDEQERNGGFSAVEAGSSSSWKGSLVLIIIKWISFFKTDFESYLFLLTHPSPASPHSTTHNRARYSLLFHSNTILLFLHSRFAITSDPCSFFYYTFNATVRDTRCV